MERDTDACSLSERGLRTINSSLDSNSLVESLGIWAIERLEDPVKADFDGYGTVLIIESLAANAFLHFYPLWSAKSISFESNFGT